MGRAYADGKEAKKQTTGPGGAYAVRLVESQPHPQVVHLARGKAAARPHVRGLGSVCVQQQGSSICRDGKRGRRGGRNATGVTNLHNKGLISEDRSNKATLLLTIPRCLFKSSAKDLSPPIFEILIRRPRSSTQDCLYDFGPKPICIM